MKKHLGPRVIALTLSSTPSGSQQSNVVNPNPCSQVVGRQYMIPVSGDWLKNIMFYLSQSHGDHGTK